MGNPQPHPPLNQKSLHQYMNFINATLTTITEWALYPLSRWPLMALLIVSAVTGVLMTLVFRYTSNQKALGRVVDRSRGHLLAIKLFKDDLRGMFRSLAHIFGLVAARLWYSLFPVLVMVIPFLFLLAQLALRYEHRPLEVGESSVVRLQLTEDAWGSHQDVELETEGQIDVETEPLRDEAVHSVYWRIKPASTGASTLRWQLGSSHVEKELMVGESELQLEKVSRRRAGTGMLDRLLNPGEPAFGMFSPVSAIEIHYPRRATPILGWPIPWWLTFFAVSIVFALMMQPVFNVRF
jgi:hypothetical protein